MIDTKKKGIRNRWMISVLLLIGSVIIIWSINESVDKRNKINIPLPLLSTLRPEPLPLENFSLIDQHSNPFTLDQLRGKWSFMFFGYTSCPDICPTTLFEMKNVANKFSQENQDNNLQFIFVSIDPERDDVEQLEEYMNHFNQEFIGLTGSQSKIDVLTQQLNVLVVREPSSNDYQFSHTSSIMLIDPKQRWFASFPPPHNDERIAKQFILLRDFYQESAD